MKIIIFLLFITISSSAYGLVRVGNGGDGVEIGPTICVSDLFESNLCPSPYVGPQSDPAILEQLNGLQNLRQLNLNNDLLARKLTDLNALMPDLGEFLLRIMAMYEWPILSSPSPFPLMPNPTLNVPAGDQRVQIAIRRDKQIQISASAWNSLDDLQRVALVLHEAFSSLQNISCLQKAGCPLDQTPSLTRQVVAQAFTSPEKRSALPAPLPELFLLPSAAQAMEDQYGLQIDLVTPHPFQANPVTVVHLPKLNNPGDAASLSKYLLDACDSLAKSSSGSSLYASYDRPDWAFQFLSFPRVGGFNQMLVVPLPVAGEVDFSQSFTAKVSQCQANLKSQANKAFNMDGNGN